MVQGSILVYHAHKDGYHHVATVDVSGYQFDNMEVNDALEYAYRWTQNLDGSWSLKIGEDANDLVTVHDVGEIGYRSSDVHDALVYNGKAYTVEPMGFKFNEFPVVKQEWFF